MRWQKYALLLCLIVLAAACIVDQVVGQVRVRGDITSASFNITVTFTPKYGIQAPTSFTATFIDHQQVNLEWTKDPTANYTVIRAKFYDYPESATDGYLVYRGDGSSVNDTFLDLDLTFGPVFYRAWSENATANTSTFSTEYAYASVENPELEGLVDQFTEFNSLLSVINNSVLALLLVCFIIVLALWKKRSIFLQLVAVGACLVYGFSLADGETAGSDLWVLGIVMAIIGLYFLFRPIMEVIGSIRDRMR